MHEQTVDRTWSALRLTYGLVPIVAGADKFTNLLVDWKTYLSPLARRALPVEASTFMKAVGIIEIGAGALVLSRYTRLGGYIVGGWLASIAVELVTARRYDIAVRDTVMAIGALALAKLSEARVQARAHERQDAVHTERPFATKERLQPESTL
jgi:uncharacterized membrane protein YphA (DoxX/SURF4 family)